MSSAAKGLSIVVLLAVGTLSQVGCRACCSPYDYSGPVLDSGCDTCSTTHGRKGSTFASATDASVVPEGEHSLVAEGTVAEDTLDPTPVTH